MSRRQTLGAVSPSGLNSRRSSVGPTRVAQGTATKQGSSGRRQSIRPPAPSGRPSTGSTRRSSIYGKGPSGPKADPRPITDKAYQQSCVRSVIAYLTSHSYENSISPKQLSSPTTKDFHSIIGFLFRQIEPSHKWVGKVEDEVPAMFKRLHYPLPISKTALVAVGSPHSWPALLAATAWLVELLTYHERAMSDESSNDLMDKGQQASDREFFDFVSTSYRYFLSGDDDACAEVDAVTEQKFQVKEEETSQDIDRIRQANEELLAQLDALTHGPTPKQKLMQKKQDFESDMDKFQSLIESLEQHKASLQKKNAEREADLIAKKQEMDLVEKESEDIRQRVGAQSINREDIIRMNNDRSKLQKILDTVTIQREKLDTEVAKTEMELEEHIERLESAAVHHNKEADQLQLIPSTTKRAAGVDFEIAVRRNASRLQDILSVDLKGTIRPSLQRIQEQYIVKRRQGNEALLTAREELAVQEESLQEKREENLAAEAQVSLLEQRHKAVRHDLESAINSTNAEVSKIQDDISAMQSEADSSVQTSEEAVAAAKEQLEQLKRACEAELNELNEDLTSALNCLVQHKLHVQEVLEELSDKATSTLQSVNGMEVPC